MLIALNGQIHGVSYTNSTESRHHYAALLTGKWKSMVQNFGFHAHLTPGEALVPGCWLLANILEIQSDQRQTGPETCYYINSRNEAVRRIFSGMLSGWSGMGSQTGVRQVGAT